MFVFYFLGVILNFFMIFIKYLVQRESENIKRKVRILGCVERKGLFFLNTLYSEFQGPGVKILSFVKKGLIGHFFVFLSFIDHFKSLTKIKKKKK